LSDHNFDPIAQKFVNNIYGTTKGKIRSEIIWLELQHCLANLPQRPLRILDAGGGFGYFSQKLAELGETLKGLLTFLSPEGLLSLMFYNREAQRFFNLISGNLEFVAKDMVRKKVVRLTPTHPLDEKEVISWLTDFDMRVTRKAGVRVIHDYLKDKNISRDKFDLLLTMEKQYCHQEPYASLGRYTHLTVKGMTE